ncbi:MAG: hypothetical protein KF715_14220 [Candidatus Didemnitutus sp.]|nr:hypothetical protein [Candidatus Didemnitutus sp.]
MSRVTPPLLPEQRLEKVLGVARADALGVLVCAGASLLVSGTQQDWIMCGFSLLALVAGGMEWHGHQRLRDRDLGGLQWLLGAQGCLYTVIAGYVLWRLQHFNAVTYWAELPAEARDQIDAQLKQSGLDVETDRVLLLRTMNFLVCTVLIFVSTLYQGGLAWFYRRHRAAISEALNGR